jgi:elongation factor P--beta-lysine ligase
MTVYVLLLITNLEPALHFEKKDVVSIFRTQEKCMAQAVADAAKIPEPYMRLECKAEDFHE